MKIMALRIMAIAALVILFGAAIVWERKRDERFLSALVARNQEIARDMEKAREEEKRLGDEQRRMFAPRLAREALPPPGINPDTTGP